MNALVLPLFIVAAAALIWGSFWAGHHLAQRLTGHPIAIALLTLLFGTVSVGILAAGLVGGCTLIVAPHF